MKKRLLAIVAMLALADLASAQVSGPWAKVRFGSDTGPTISSGTGSPEGVVNASGGSLFLQTDGASGFTLWTKVGTGTTGWEAPSGGGGGTHNLLSATHPDASTAAVLRGSMIVGNSTPKWARVTIGAAGTFWRSDGTDPGWSTNGASLTALNGTQVTTGTVADARLSANVSLLGSAISSSEITDGTIVFADWASNSCSSNEIPKWSGSAWACAADEAGGGGAAHEILSATHTDTDADTLVEGDILVVGTGDLLTRLAPGSDGDVLTVTSGVPAWEASGGGGLVLVEQHTASASASLDFTTCISSTYDDYVIRVVSLVSNTNTAAINLLVSTDGGSSYVTSGYLSQTYVMRLNNGTEAALASSSGVQLHNSFGTGVTRAMVSGSVLMFNPQDATLNKAFTIEMVVPSSDGFWYKAEGGAVYDSASAVTDFQIKPSSGTLTSGTVRCYGVQK